MEYFAGRAATGFAIPEWLPIPDNVQYNRAVSDLEGIVYNIIAQRKSQGAQQEAAEVRDSILQGQEFMALHCSSSDVTGPHKTFLLHTSCCLTIFRSHDRSPCNPLQL